MKYIFIVITTCFNIFIYNFIGKMAVAAGIFVALSNLLGILVDFFDLTDHVKEKFLTDKEKACKHPTLKDVKMFKGDCIYENEQTASKQSGSYSRIAAIQF